MNPDLGHILAKFTNRSANLIENILLRVLYTCFDEAYVFMWKHFYVSYMSILFILAANFLWERKSPVCTQEKAISSINVYQDKFL